jgi:hypothetical protein
MSEVKTLQEAVAEVKKTTKNSISEEKTLLDEFAMAAVIGLISSNRAKDVGINSYIIASQMMEERKKYIK